jgi:hypothetical protein
MGMRGGSDDAFMIVMMMMMMMMMMMIVMMNRGMRCSGGALYVNIYKVQTRHVTFKHVTRWG